MFRCSTGNGLQLLWLESLTSQKIAPHVNYFHIVDAKGSDGEGVEIGKGDVNFELFSELINKKCRDIPFIPEVWQGHKDDGAGFFNALNFLEKYL